MRIEREECVPKESGRSGREMLERLIMQLQSIQPGEHESELKDWRARADEVMCKLYGPRHRSTLDLRAVTFVDFAQGRARAVALLRAAVVMAAAKEKSESKPAVRAKPPASQPFNGLQATLAPARPRAAPELEAIAAAAFEAWPEQTVELVETPAVDSVKTGAIVDPLDTGSRAAMAEEGAAEAPVPSGASVEPVLKVAAEPTAAVAERAPEVSEPKRRSVVRKLAWRRDFFRGSRASADEGADSTQAPPDAAYVAETAEPIAPAEAAETAESGTPTGSVDIEPLTEPAEIDSAVKVSEVEKAGELPEMVSAVEALEGGAPEESPAVDTSVGPTAEALEPALESPPVLEIAKLKRRSFFRKISRKRDISAASAVAPGRSADGVVEPPESSVVEASPELILEPTLEFAEAPEVSEPVPEFAEAPEAVEAALPKRGPFLRGLVRKRDSVDTAEVHEKAPRMRRPIREWLAIAGIVIGFLALAVGVPVWLVWFGGLSLFSGDETTVATVPGTSTSTGISSPSANARVVDIADDPRGDYIVGALRAGIIQLMPDEAGEVSFLPGRSVKRGEFLVWLDRVRRIPAGTGDVPNTLYYDLDASLREKAVHAYQSRIVLAWPDENTKSAFDATGLILARDAEAWTARMIIRLLPAGIVQRELGTTEQEARDLRARISSLKPDELTKIVEGFEIRPEEGWAKKESISRSEAAEFLMRLKAVFDTHL